MLRGLGGSGAGDYQNLQFQIRHSIHVNLAALTVAVVCGLTAPAENSSPRRKLTFKLRSQKTPVHQIYGPVLSVSSDLVALLQTENNLGDVLIMS